MQNKRISTGLAGLDQILGGGLISKKAYLLRGGPGSGKTTMGLHYLCAEEDDNSLLITLMEPKQSLNANAEKIGLPLDKVQVLDLSPEPEYIKEDNSFEVFPANEVEQDPLVKKIINKIEQVKPKRLFLDGLTQLEYLAPDSFQYRKQVLSLIKYAVSFGATVLISSEAISSDSDNHLQFICDGVINLELDHESRFLKISKLRGTNFKSGLHSFIINDQGVQIYPKVLAPVKRRELEQGSISSGIPELDELLHGGLERGTDTIISGPTGVGKTSLGLQFIKEAAGRGERSAVYSLEEGRQSILKRSKAINIPIESMREKEKLSITKIDPFQYSPEKLASRIQAEVEGLETKIVMLDSVNSYFTTFNQTPYTQRELIRRLHNLSEYLKHMGVTVLKVVEISSVTGQFLATEHGVSYMADNIVFLRFFESRGRLHKAIGVLKKRMSNFEKTLREFKITKYGLRVGEPLQAFRGILTGNPELELPEDLE